MTKLGGGLVSSSYSMCASFSLILDFVIYSQPFTGNQVKSEGLFTLLPFRTCAHPDPSVITLRAICTEVGHRIHPRFLPNAKYRQ